MSACRRTAPIERFAPGPAKPKTQLAAELERLAMACSDSPRGSRVYSVSCGERVWFIRPRGIGEPGAIHEWAYDQASGRLVFLHEKRGWSDVYFPCVTECIQVYSFASERRYGEAVDCPEVSNRASWRFVCDEPSE